jgi:hypothetical protein
MLLLGVSMVFLWKKYSRKIQRGAVSSFLIFIVIGPVLQYFIVGVVGNFFLSYKVDPEALQTVGVDELRTLVVSERFDALVNVK